MVDKFVFDVDGTLSGRQEIDMDFAVFTDFCAERDADWLQEVIEIKQ